ncbi:MAG: hypothetical protein PHV51_08725 [Methanosarcinaceae archaeon]|nr:hypothetical protein [Methanosarcinaceae archaeon]MDD4498213.1 hypothetical protein [Methanosarcinaceae archaeon]
MLIRIGATVRYRAHTGKKQVLSMRSKEVRCVCPFLKEKVIYRAVYLKLSPRAIPPNEA